MEFVPVSLGEIKISSDPQDVLVCYGLGSCVAVCLYDKSRKMGGMFHCVLPFAMNGSRKDARYADVGIPALIESMLKKGSVKFGLKAKIVGGASVLAVNNPLFDIGSRNVSAVRDIFKKSLIEIVSEEVGRHISRTVKFHVSDGSVAISTKMSEERKI